MAQKMSTGLCNHLLAGGSVKNAFEGAASELRIYGGTVPATADASIGSATLLCTVKNGGSAITFDSAASGGVLAKNSTETWNGTNGANGTATFYRLVNTSDDGSASTTAKRIQGTVGTGGTDMVVGNAALVSAATFTVNYFTQAFVPS